MLVDTGVCGEVRLTVATADTAAAMGSGEVPVLATPRVVALCEEATLQALAGKLAQDETSVGARVEIAHLAPVVVGTEVRASAILERTEGRRLVFSVTVTDACGLVAVGRVTRSVVNRDAFLARAR